MTQTDSLPRLTLELSPQQLLDAISPTQEGHLNLLAYPGAPSDLLVRVCNDSDRSLQLHLEVEGDFPSDYCDWNQPEPEEVAPRGKITKKIAFSIPNEFFHDPQIRSPLDFRCRILVYAEIYQKKQLAAYKTFYLCVRPFSRYINLLPGFYREIDFFNRFLAIFEQAFDPAVQTLETLWAYCDPLTAPEKMLPFLASWVAWEMDDRLEIEQQRRLIRHATTLYRWRGTRFGLRFYLHLYTGLPLDENLPEADKHIGIEEIFGNGFTLGSARLGRDAMLGGGKPYHFSVCLRLEKSNRVDEKLIREIIEREKPAFCSYDLNIFHSENNEYIE